MNSQTVPIYAHLFLNIRLIFKFLETFPWEYNQDVIHGNYYCDILSKEYPFILDCWHRDSGSWNLVPCKCFNNNRRNQAGGGVCVVFRNHAGEPAVGCGHRFRLCWSLCLVGCGTRIVWRLLWKQMSAGHGLFLYQQFSWQFNNIQSSITINSLEEMYDAISVSNYWS